jgi:hypothetical protein
MSCPSPNNENEGFDLLFWSWQTQTIISYKVLIERAFRE